MRPIHSTIIVDESQHTRTVLFDLAGTLGADLTHPPEGVIKTSKVLYVDHYGIEGMTRAAQVARAAGIPIVADLERNEWPGFSDLLALVDHLIVGQSFAEKLTGLSDPRAAVEALWSANRQVVIVTHGENGAWYRSTVEATVRHQPAYRVNITDTTGCGDVFHGAYAAALAHGADLAERVRFASAAAALKAMHPGAQRGIPRRDDVEAFLRGQERYD